MYVRMHVYVFVHRKTSRRTVICLKYERRYVYMYVRMHVYVFVHRKTSRRTVICLKYECMYACMCM
jgi:hypothetical protein